MKEDVGGDVFFCVRPGQLVWRCDGTGTCSRRFGVGGTSGPQLVALAVTLFTNDSMDHASKDDY